MRLIVSIPDGASDVRVEVDPIVPLPEDRKAWGEEVLRREIPADGTVEQSEIAHLETFGGWPMTVVTTRVRDAASRTVEVRITAFYELIYYGAAVVCRFLTRASSAWEAAIRDMLSRAEPQLGDEAPFGIQDLYR